MLLIGVRLVKNSDVVVEGSSFQYPGRPRVSAEKKSQIVDDCFCVEHFGEEEE